MTQIVLSAVGVDFGAITLLDDVSVTVARGEKWGIVGRNGSGKTTLFQFIIGMLTPTRGTVTRVGTLRVALLEQYRDFGSATTVWDVAAQPFEHLIALEHSLVEQAENLGEDVTERMLTRYGSDQERFAREGGYEFHAHVDSVLHGLGFDPSEARVQPLVQLSGGERGRIGLARQLVAPADIVLLDEPTNHLDLDTTRWLEEYLRDLDETVLVISHDREFLERVIDHVLHLEDGTATPYTGSYSAFVAQRDERRLARQRAYEQQQRTVAREEDYIRRNIAGQNSKQARGRRARLERLPRLSPPSGERGTMALRLEIGDRGGDRVLSAESVRVRVGDRVLLEDFTTMVTRGEVIGLIGRNGMGKTTLLRTLIGERHPEAGTVRIGDSIIPAWYRQDLAQVPLDRPLIDVMSDLRPMWGRGAIQSHLGRFGFSGDTVQQSASTLSGGERARLALAMIVLSRANLLLLDEPTNHLDVESIEALEDALSEYEGTVIMVSHDRALLRSLITRVWHLQEGRIVDSSGSFSDWETVRGNEERSQNVRNSRHAVVQRERERSAARRGAQARKDENRELRRLRLQLEIAEGEVAVAESRVTELMHHLADPMLYAVGDGVQQTRALNAALLIARRELDAALERWTVVMNELELSEQ